MPTSNPKQMEARALKIIAERDKVKGLIIAHTAEDVAPSTGAKIFEFQAVKKDDPNGPHYVVVLDETGAVEDLQSLSQSEGKQFFTLLEYPVDMSAIKQVNVPPPSTTIDPTVNTEELDEGDTTNEIITVTVPANAVIPKADVYFLADTTGSMVSILASVQAGTNAILTALNSLGRDIAFGVGNYKDFPGDPSGVFQHQLIPTRDTDEVIAKINEWRASGGGDVPEGQFFALDQLAVPPGGSIGWRSGSKRIIVWFGDAPGHDPICKEISGFDFDITEPSVTDKLIAQGIAVLAISTTTGSDPAALEGDPKPGATNYVSTCGPPGGNPGQASRIANATGGVHITGINSTNIVTTIVDLVTAAATTINKLSLVPTGRTTPFVNAISPAEGYGPLSSQTEHTLPFDVTFRGVVPCTNSTQTFTGAINAVADGVVVATKTVTVTVPACKPFDPQKCCDEITAALNAIATSGSAVTLQQCCDQLSGAVRDIATFIPTKNESAGGVGGGGGANGSFAAQRVSKVVAQILGRPVGGDPKLFLTALTAAFPEGKDGQIVQEPSRAVVSLEVESGQLPASQVTLFRETQLIVNDALKVLDGLHSITFRTDKEKAQALTEIVRSEFSSLSREAGIVDRPRKSRVDEIFAQLLPPRHLGQLRTELGLNAIGDALNNPDLVTSGEAQLIASMELLDQYAATLNASFQRFFLTAAGQDPSNGSFSGRLVFVSMLFSVVLASVREVEDDMDAVELSKAERRTTFIFDPIAGAPFRISIDSILSWISDFASVEGPDLIAKSGLIGLNRVLGIVRNQLKPLVDELLLISTGGSLLNPPPAPHPGLTHSRVRNALQQLDNQLTEF